MYAKTVNGLSVQYPYTIAQFRRDNPDTSFPEEISDTVLGTHGVYPVIELEAPLYDSKVHDIVPGTPTLNGDEWQVNYSISNKSEDEAESNVIVYRDCVLAETDHLTLPENKLSAEMSTYRQALKDIPNQEGFPFNVTWPIRPE